MNPGFALHRTQPAAAAQICNLHWHLATPRNPKGIASLSPGLRGTSYPGSAHPMGRQPCRGCLTAPIGPLSPPSHGTRSNPFRVGTASDGIPRVARASQPRAERFHPFRIRADLPRL
jgi:hypothetical protein